MEVFYKEVEGKRKGQKTRLQTDQEFKHKKIFHLDKKFNVEMFSMAVRGGKAFVAEQKLREVEKSILRLKALEKKTIKKINPCEIIKKSADNINSLPTAKYKQVSNDIEKNTLSSETDRERFNFSRLEKISKEKIKLKNIIKKFTREKYQS